MEQLPPATDESIPLPPPHLRYRVAGTDFDKWFTKSGRMSVDDLFRALASIGKSFDQFHDILEWGCGCGRILRHLPVSPGSQRIYGNDIDQDAIAWVRENLPWIETSRTDGMPPLPYADGSFDLVYNHSVMTHLNSAYQDAWLAELRRVLRPGGILTLTVSGRNAFQIFLDAFPIGAPEREFHSKNLLSRGIYFIDQDQWSGDFPEFYHTTFHEVSYIFNHWAEFLEVRCYIGRGALDYQDMVVLQKPLDNASVFSSFPDVTVPNADVASVDSQHVIDELRREKKLASDELAALRPMHAELQEVYASRSWALTKPWRAVGRRIKALRAPYTGVP